MIPLGKHEFQLITDALKHKTKFNVVMQKVNPSFI